jgi:hypothetical protein
VDGVPVDAALTDRAVDVVGDLFESQENAGDSTAVDTQEPDQPTPAVDGGSDDPDSTP